MDILLATAFVFFGAYFGIMGPKNAQKALTEGKVTAEAAAKSTKTMRASGVALVCLGVLTAVLHFVE